MKYLKRKFLQRKHCMIYKKSVKKILYNKHCKIVEINIQI